MCTIDDVVDTLRLVVDCDSARAVVAESHARQHVDAVSLVAADRDWRHVRNRLGVKGALGRSPERWPGRRLVEMIALAGLVVDEVDDANRMNAEGILRG